MKKVVGVLFFSVLACFVFSQGVSQEADGQDEDESARIAEGAEAESEPQIDQNLLVSKINFIGLKKTQKSYIQSRVGKFVGGTLGETDMHALETAIQLEGLFDDIQISVEESGEGEAEINVSVKEKITFIPLPFAMYSSSGFMAGGVVMDTNAFGRKDMFMLGGVFSNDSKMAVASFAKNGAVWGFSIFGLFSKDTPELCGLDGGTVLEYNSLSGGASVGVSYKFSERQSVSMSLSFKTFSLKSENGYSYEVGSLTAGTAGFSYSASTSDWNGLFMSTNSFRISGEVGITSAKDKNLCFPHNYSVKLSAQKPVLSQRLRAYSSAAGYLAFNAHISDFQGQGAASVSILPQKFSAERLFGGNAGIEFAVIKGKYALVSLYSDYQVAWAEDFGADDFDFTFMHGPNGGVRVYLARIAVPALALGVSYNVTKSNWQFAASLGMSF